jgi:hypothetical protein
MMKNLAAAVAVYLPTAMQCSDVSTPIGRYMTRWPALMIVRIALMHRIGWLVNALITIPLALIAPMMSLRMQYAGEDRPRAKNEPEPLRDLDIGDKVRRAAIPLPAAVYTIGAIEKQNNGIEMYRVSRNYDGKDVDRLFYRHELVLFRRAPAWKAAARAV